MTTTSDDENKSHISTAKKIKLPSFDHDLKSEGRNEGVLTETRSKNVELLFPNSSLSPEECVLSVDHIRESIFLYCDRETLMTSRLVSRRWAYYGSKALQKTGLITLPGSFSISRPGQPPIFQCDSHEFRSMKNLITLINNSTEFPASSFYLNNWKIEGENTAQSFFDAHGALIKKIIFEGNVWIDDLKQLILTQALNLEELHLRNLLIMNRNTPWNFDPTETNKQRLERKRLEESIFDETHATGSKPILKTLKVFKCCFSCGMPDVLMRQILECSPNLVQVTLPENRLHFLVQPTNRLHLLRNLELKIDSRSIDSVEAVANHCHEGNWGVRELRYLGGYRFDVENITQFDQRVASIMSKIVSVSSNTCKTLEWFEYPDPDNFRIPVMPKVEQLTFQYYENEDTGYPVNILPEGTSLADTFPNLKWLKIRSRVCMKDLLIENIFGGNNPFPVPSVKKVILRFYKFRDRLRQRFQMMFPNATICNKFYDRVQNEYGESYDDNSSGSDSDELCGYISDDEVISDSEIKDVELNDNDEIHDVEINNDEVKNDEVINDYDSNDERFDDERNYDAFSDDKSNDEDIGDKKKFESYL